MGKRPRVLLLNGKETTVTEAAKIVGCSQASIYGAIRTKRYCIYSSPVCWADDIHPVNKQRDHFKPCYIDGVYWPSVASAARHYGFIKETLCHALDQKDEFRGHSILWADASE